MASLSATPLLPLEALRKAAQRNQLGFQILLRSPCAGFPSNAALLPTCKGHFGTLRRPFVHAHQTEFEALCGPYCCAKIVGPHVGG